MKTMVGLPRICACASILIIGLLLQGAAFAQQLRSMTSKHVVLQFPPEREILVRELSAEAERCYEHMNRAVNNGLPRNISVVLDWNATESTWNHLSGRVVIGMNNPDGTANPRKFLKHALPHGIARLALISYSMGANRDDTEFLFEGMAEILTHEYNHTSRSLDAAWATAKLLDETCQLGFSLQRVWTEFSGEKKNHRNVAPGITFLLTQREIDRGRLMKFFDSLRKNSLLNALNASFKAPATELEASWLEIVRSYEIPEEITVQNSNAPVLLKITQVDSLSSASADHLVRLELFITDSDGDIYKENIFVRDLSSGKTLQVQDTPRQDGAESEASSYFVDIPVEDNCPAGDYHIKVIIIDDAGNLRQADGTYSIS